MTKGNSGGEEFRNKIARIVTWKSGTRRAPHKPLQLLLMVANVQRNGPRLVPFVDIEPKLRAALLAFGPVRKSIHPEYPFWHLTNDGIWETQSDSEVTLRRQSLNPTAKELRSKNARGGFFARDYDAIKSSPRLQSDIIHDILGKHFPSSIHDDIIHFFEISILSNDDNPRQGHAKFRHDVLAAYDGACAVSNFGVKMGEKTFGVEPAHVLWPQAGGLSVVSNAIAMSSLHRKLFHLGVFTVDANYRVRISKQVKGNGGFPELLGQFEGKKISLPVAQKDQPDLNALRWHREQVFRH